MKKIILLLTVIGFMTSCNNTKGWSSADRKKFVNDCTSEAAKGMDESKARSYCECMQPKLEAKYPTVTEANKMTEADLQSSGWMTEVQNCLGMEKSDLKINDGTTDNTSTTPGDDNKSFSEGWSQRDKDNFYNDCVGEAEKGMDRAKAQSYCGCMRDKLEKIYPDFNRANQITDADMATPSMKAMVKDCLLGY